MCALDIDVAFNSVYLTYGVTDRLDVGAVVPVVSTSLRGSSDAKTPEQRGAFESKLSVVRRLILAFDVAILAAAGYWIGNMFGGVRG